MSNPDHLHHVWRFRWWSPTQYWAMRRGRPIPHQKVLSQGWRSPVIAGTMEGEFAAIAGFQGEWDWWVLEVQLLNGQRVFIRNLKNKFFWTHEKYPSRRH